jgi:2-furoyl-CoA dehydrogenase large subunit
MLEGAAKVVLRQLFESLGRVAAGGELDATGGSAPMRFLQRLFARFRRHA